ncbi:MAG: ECF transporter S component [Clostridioides sp.]|jgi:riboflavin transporter FmnP|nr:ECF transporter S component [Clostridioides sp.]
MNNKSVAVNGNTKGSMKTRTMVMMAILSAISVLLMYIEAPIPGVFPDFLKLDLSDIPAILGGMAFGPFVGLGIEFLKNLIHGVTASTTGGIGEVANIIVAGAYVFVLTFAYNKSKNIKGVLTGAVLATIAMAVVGGIVNYYILLPFYGQFMGLDAIIGLGSAINHNIKDLFSFVLWMIVPFNLIKGTILSVGSVFIFKKVGHLIKKN